LAERGIEVISPTYTLSGTAPYPAAYNDISAAIEQAYSPNIPLFVAGRSSGGHLALLCSYTHPDLVKGVIGIYPPVDMVWSYENPSNPAVLDSQEAIIQFLTTTPGESPEKYEDASPIDRVHSEGPPTLLIHGRADCLVFHKQSEMLSQRLDQLGVRRYLLTLPWMEHGGDVILGGPSGRLTAWAIEGFVDSLK
jgi:acetyl esterase/lipase